MKRAVLEQYSKARAVVQSSSMRRSALVLLAMLLAACRAQIQHGLEERDANEVVSALLARGFAAEKVSEKGKKPTFSIEVEEAQVNDALRVLTELKLPRPPRTTTREVTAQAGLIETPSAERLRQLEAQEGDVEQSLETMDGVTSAAVELVVPGSPRPGQPIVPSKASVLLRVQPESMERVAQQRAEIRALVAASVEGLKSDDVVLVVDSVTSQVGAPVAAKAPEAQLRVLVFGLAGLVALLSCGLLFAAVRMRSLRAIKSAIAAPVTPPHVPKPTVNPSVTRRVA
jgi:type III secretion protein J